MKRLKPALYDLQMRLVGGRLEQRRRALVGGAAGRILELGVGTGQNLRWYEASTRVIGVDPDLAMLKRASPRASGGAGSQVSLVSARGEALPFRDGAFDEVVASLVF